MGLLTDEGEGSCGYIQPNSLGSDSNVNVGSSTVTGDSTRDEGSDGSEEGLLSERKR